MVPAWPPGDVLDVCSPGPRSDPAEADIVDTWRAAEARHAARLARVAARLGMLDERLRRGPAGWRHRLALVEAADLSWLTLDRIGLDRLSLYVPLRVSAATEDAQSLYRMGWTVRRLSGGPGPLVPGSDVAALEAFLDRRDRPGQGAQVEDAPLLARVWDTADREAFAHRAAAWIAMMQQAKDLHPISRACRASLKMTPELTEGYPRCRDMADGDCDGADGLFDLFGPLSEPRCQERCAVGDRLHGTWEEFRPVLEGASVPHLT